MNNVRRKYLDEISDKLSELCDLIDELRIEEEDARDSVPDSLRETENFKKMEEALDNLSSAETCIDDALEFIYDAMK